MITGSADYLLRVIVSDIEALQMSLAKTLTRIPEVSRVSSSLAVKSVIQRVVPPLSSGLSRAVRERKKRRH
jgi:Lrp/AsnC family transcriptional regulator, leucine-responsive regulatory protein